MKGNKLDMDAIHQQKGQSAVTATALNIISLNDGAEQQQEQGTILPTVFSWRWDNEPPKVPPVLTLADSETGEEIRVGSVGNITAILGAPGSSKSTVCESIIAHHINPDIEPLTMAVHTTGDVVYVDTERSPENFWASLTRAMHRAGLRHGDPVPKFRSYLFDDLSKEQARTGLQEIIDAGNIGLLILDGIADFIDDTNDLAECETFLKYLVRSARSGEFAVLTTIHTNIGSPDGKARGHLGSEIQRRAEAVLILQRKGDIRTLTPDATHGKVRNASDRMKLSFTFDKERGMFTPCATPDTSGSTYEELKSLFSALFAAHHGYRHADLVQAVITQTGKSERTAKSRIKDAVTNGIIRKDAADLMYILAGDTEPF
jgi:hypothetical protein